MSQKQEKVELVGSFIGHLIGIWVGRPVAGWISGWLFSLVYANQFAQMTMAAGVPTLTLPMLGAFLGWASGVLLSAR